LDSERLFSPKKTLNKLGWEAIYGHEETLANDES